MFQKSSLLLLFSAFSAALHAQTIWTDVAESGIPAGGERLIVPQRFRSVRLAAAALQPVLAAAPERFSAAASKPGELPVLALPMPDGRTGHFRLTESPVMAPELQAQYPGIRCYTGRGIDDPTALLKCDWTPQGFHAMVLSALHSTVFIDPYSRGDTEHYTVYFKKDYSRKKDGLPFVCETETTGLQEINLKKPAAKIQGDCQLRRYRLALACTGEYAAFQGGTTALALAAMNTTMNRVNGVYENDFAVTMQIIANNNLIVYLNSSTDPYSNGNGNNMLGQNQTTCNNIIGTANYDIGHVFSTGGGGVAWVGVVCSGDDKARGVTGNSSPIGDPFDIDYVAHEMGHQFGALHTFNGTDGSCAGNIDDIAAVEPGSGSTIMAYAGICDNEDIQSNSDDYFHAISIEEVNLFTINDNGNTCPVKLASGNSNPTVSAGANYTIPKSTPFALSATGSDPNGDALSYCWEQMDADITANPPEALSATGPLFRSFKPTASPLRYFPRLSDLVNNTDYPWEELPGVARTLNFRVTARDNRDNAGCTDEDDMVLTIAGNSGPFTVTAPNTNELWYVGDTKTVTWNVSNTTAPPVSCANVRILLSTDGGFNYPVVLAANVPNNGSANVLVPNNLSNTCRVKVEAVGNIFFDISNQNFRIQLPPVPTFLLENSTDSIKICTGDTVTLTVNITSVLNFNNPVSLAVEGLPPGAVATISPNPAAPGSSASISIFGLTPAMAGAYNLTVRGTSGSIVQTASIHLNVIPGPPADVAVTGPTDGAKDVFPETLLAWNSVPYAEYYKVEAATNPAFTPGSMVLSETVADTGFLTPPLQAGTVYYWRVRGENSCGAGDFSPFYSFQTGNFSCGQTFVSADVPKTISTGAPGTVVSILNMPAGKSIADVDVTIAANHSYVGDLIARLVSPWNDTVLLFDRPGDPAITFGCENNNLALTFDSQAALSADSLENQCNATSPALLGAFRPIESLDAFKGHDAQGDWTLSVTDVFQGDGGSIIAWNLSFCFQDSIPPGVLALNNPLSVPAGGSGAITGAYLALALSGAAAQGKFTLLSLPQHGTLTLNGAPLAFGDSFTQADINANALVYKHNGDGTTADNFTFDAVDLNNFAWVKQAVFNLIIIQNNLAATAVLTSAVLCHDDANGQITVSASGLDGQYQYSLNGGPGQSSNVFGGLTAGSYTAVVTGQFGFTVSANTVIISNPPALSIGVSVAGDNLTVSASGGTGALEYSLDAANFQLSNSFENLANGVYTVTVRDANGCTASTQAIVAVNTLVVNLTVGKPVACTGGSDGLIVVTLGGGKSPYSYSLNSGAFQPDSIFAGLAAGVYSVEVKDNEGFTATTNQVTLTDPPAISVSASANLNVITVSASGGTGAFSYSLDGVNFQASSTFGGLVNGDYTVTVRDANGCTATTGATVAVPPLAIDSFNILQPILCYDDEASVFITATGGVPPYQYSVDGGPYQSSNVFSIDGKTDHFFRIRDAAGTVVESLSFLIPEPTPVEAFAIVNGNDVTFTAIGGVPPYQFSYAGPVPPVNLPNGNYTVTATDANGCTSTANFTVNIPALNASIAVLSVDCIPSAMIEVTATGGEPPYQYSLNGGPFLNGNTFTVFGGPNNVRIRDALGTIVQVPVNVNLPQSVQLSASVSGDTIFASAQFGEAPYEFSIDGVNFQPAPVFPGLPNGTYTLTVQDNNGCTDTLPVVVNVSGAVEPSAAWGLIIAPNPSTGLFRLSLPQAPAMLRIEVFDAAGRRLRSPDVAAASSASGIALDLSDLPQGTYMLRLTDGKNWGGARLSIVR